MFIIQLIKKLNNTELGKSGTHETYIHIPQNLDISDIFPEPNIYINFYYKEKDKEYRIRCTIGREKRIVGLGDFYRDNNVCAGDEVLLEKCIDGDKSSYNIKLKRNTNGIIIQKCKTGFEILNIDKKDLINQETKILLNNIESTQPLSLEFITSVKKREDSPNKTDIYDLKINDKSIAKNYTGKDIMEILIHKESNIAYLNKVCIWKKYNFKVGK